MWKMKMMRKHSCCPFVCFLLGSVIESTLFDHICVSRFLLEFRTCVNMTKQFSVLKKFEVSTKRKGNQMDI